jgi:hypothetical protein
MTQTQAAFLHTPQGLVKPLLKACLLIALVLIVRLSWATTLMSIEIDEVAGKAELIFEGRVLAVAGRADTAGTISTYITFDVLDVIKGDYDAATLELKFLGGNVNGRITEVSGLRQPELGEAGIYFVESLSVDLVNPLLGWSQGHYLIQTDEDGIRRVSSTDNLPVTDLLPMAHVPALIRKPQQLVNSDTDVATGVMTESNALMIERAMTVEEFKLRIEELVEAQAQ